MTLAAPPSSPPPSPPSSPPADPVPTTRGQDRGRRGGIGFLRRPLWNRFTPLQTLVVALASIPPALVALAIVSRVLGVTSEAQMMDLALGAGENPGTIIFGAMFLASPVQWLTGRSQVRVRKFLGIVFYLLALSNGAMFAIERGLTEAFSAPFLAAGSAALAIGLPLFLTSSTWAQRTMGMRRWRLLHKATYAVAAAVLAHVVLLGEIDLGAALITAGFVLRIPTIRRWVQRIGAGR